MAVEASSVREAWSAELEAGLAREVRPMEGGQIGGSSWRRQLLEMATADSGGAVAVGNGGWRRRQQLAAAAAGWRLPTTAATAAAGGCAGW